MIQIRQRNFRLEISDFYQNSADCLTTSITKVDFPYCHYVNRKILDMY